MTTQYGVKKTMRYKLVAAVFDVTCFMTGFAAGGWMLSILVDLKTGVM